MLQVEDMLSYSHACTVSSLTDQLTMPTRRRLIFPPSPNSHSPAAHRRGQPRSAPANRAARAVKRRLLMVRNVP